MELNINSPAYFTNHYGADGQATDSTTEEKD